MPVTRDQFAGCLIGQCLGDALGFPVEGDGPTDCATWAREVVLEGRLPTKGGGGFPFGQYSDGSQLTRELLVSWRDRRGFDPADYAGRIARLFSSDEVVGHGRATQAAAGRLAEGIPWQQAGTPAPAAGNGSALRAGPVGLLCRDDPEAMVRVALDQGRITHADPRCQAGAVAVAGAVFLAAREPAIQPSGFLRCLREWAGRIEPTMECALRRLEGWLELPPDQAAHLVAREGMPPGADSQWRGGISAFVVGSVLWALYAFLRSPDDYRSCIAIAIQPGGDVDTTASMAGAMCGARVGLTNLPRRLVPLLQDRGAWRAADLESLAAECFAIGWDGRATSG